MKRILKKKLGNPREKHFVFNFIECYRTIPDCAFMFADNYRPRDAAFPEVTREMFIEDLKHLLLSPVLKEFLDAIGIQRNEIEAAIIEEDLEKQQAFFNKIGKICDDYYTPIERKMMIADNERAIAKGEEPPFPELLEENQI